MAASDKYKTDKVAHVFDGVKFKTQPWAIQAQTLAFVLDDHLRSHIWMPIGRGKSWVALMAAQVSKCRRILVICPNSVVTSWERQVARHTHMASQAVIGSSERRSEIVLGEDKGGVFIVNYEGLLPLCCDFMQVTEGEYLKRKHVINPKKLDAVAASFDMVIVDESHSISDPRASRTKIIHQLGHQIPYVLAMTGTPISKDSRDLWAQQFLLDGGASLFQSYWKFRKVYFKQVGMQWFPKKKASRKILYAIDNDVIRFSENEVDGLPDIVFEDRFVTLSTEQFAYYESAERGLIKGIEEESISINSVPHQQMVLAEITGGHIKQEGNIIRIKPNNKLKELVELLQELLTYDGKIIVFHCFIEDGRMIEEALTKAKIQYASMRGEIKNKNAEEMKFNNDEGVRVLIANQSSCGVGTNFEDSKGKIVANRIVFYSREYSTVRYSQSIGRIRRGGQDRKCLVIDLLAAGTIDEEIRDAVMSKTASIERTLEYFQKRKKEINSGKA
jgi:SNF2 family DNA or RNA helicase